MPSAFRIMEYYICIFGFISNFHDEHVKKIV